MLKYCLMPLLALFAITNAGAEDQAAFMEPMRVEKNIRYQTIEGSAAERNMLDIYAPAEGENHPILIWIHGGGWRFGDKRIVQQKPETFVAGQGFVLVCVNYRFHPEVTYKEQASDVSAAISWVRSHASEYGADADKLFLMGHSAGAHLAALVATDHQYFEAVKEPISAVQGVVLLDGAAYHVPEQIENSQGSIAGRLYKTVFGADKTKQLDASPAVHIQTGKQYPPFLLLHVADREASKLQAELLAEKLKEMGGTATIYSAADKTHGTINREIGSADDAPTAAILKFLEEYR